MLEKLFKSKRQREIEQNIRIQRSLTLHKQQIGKLEHHERQYMEKAQKAKKMGDMSNFKQLCRLVAQTTNQRRAIESQLLHFETLLQTRDRAKLFGEFAKGMKEMSHSIRDTFNDFSADEILQDLEVTLARTGEMESAMNMVLDRVSSGTEPVGGGENMVSEDQIAALVSEQVDGKTESLDRDIDESLRAIEKQLRQREQV